MDTESESENDNISVRNDPDPLKLRGAWQINATQRFFMKNGSSNFTFKGISNKRRLFFSDIFTTFIDSTWKNLILIFFGSFIFSWVLFSLLWMSIIHIHGDMEQIGNDAWQPCITNIHKYESILMFSIETQTTIGYGSRYVTEECPEAIILLMLQSVFGAMLQSLLGGILLARIQVPKLRIKTLVFSRNACISLENGELCLTVRVGNMRKSSLVGAHARAVCVLHKKNGSGEWLPDSFFELDVGFQTGADRLQLWWPVNVVHVIDKNSPFWELSRSKLASCNIELIFILEGSVEHNSNGMQGRASYVSDEILWGRKFFTLVDKTDPNVDYKVDFKYFDDTLPASQTPEFSAKDLAKWKESKAYRDYNTPPLERSSHYYRASNLARRGASSS